MSLDFNMTLIYYGQNVFCDNLERSGIKLHAGKTKHPTRTGTPQNQDRQPRKSRSKVRLQWLV